MTQRLLGKVIVVTGAGAGVGKEIALEAARQGARVVVNDLGVSMDGAGGSAGPAQETVDQIREAGGEASDIRAAGLQSMHALDHAPRIVKYRMYIDEVGNSDLDSSKNPNERYLSLTGVIIDLDYVSTVLHPQLEAIKQRYFKSHPDDPLILHRKEIVNKNYPFHSLKEPEIEKRLTQIY